MSSNDGARYIDKYEVLGEIGRGAMGGVYKALHPQLRKYVAIKEINSELAGEAEVRRRFEQEAELLARIPPHPNIVMVRDAFVWLGQLYLVMDYIEGETLKDRLNDGMSLESGLQLLDQIMSALDAIHASGIVHMDLKPANILIDREGISHLSDFGVAECIGNRKRDRLWGTAKYVAPELIDPSLGRGGVAQQVDIYSLGFIACETLLGERRFREEFSEVYNHRAEERIERWIAWHTDLARAPRNLNDIDPSIPRAIGNLVERMMAKDVTTRYRTVSDASRDLQAWFSTPRDMRGRRSGPPRDDSTVPLDQLRAGGSRPLREGVRKPSGPISQPVFNRERPPGEPARVDPLPGPPPRQGSRFPRWGWWVGLAAALPLVIAVALAPLLVASPGFTLVVKGAPAGSEVLVDGTRVGSPANDGTIKAFGLEAIKERKVVVKCPGGGEYTDFVNSRDGDVRDVLVQCQGELPSEIDYRGTAMILIPAGEFLMGDNGGEADEKPQQPVSVEAFYIDKYELTNEEYQRFCEATGQHYPPTSHPFYQEYFNNLRSPVIGVSWNEAQKFAKWAEKRLPKEAEWEKAASWDPKANKKRRWPWGDDEQPERARLADRDGYPSVVDSYPQGVSAYGVFNMAGNVAEWVDESYVRYPGNVEPPPWQHAYGNQFKVARGGSVFSQIAEVRTTSRASQPPDIKPSFERQVKTTFGIRCAISANDPRVLDILKKRQTSR